MTQRPGNQLFDAYFTARDMREAMPVTAAVESVQNKPQADNKANIDIFDIPAFLRKQAD